MLPEQLESVGALLSRVAGERGESLAIWAEGRTLTYAQLLSQAQSVASGLRARGLQDGDRVALLMPNIVEAYVGYFGVALAGGVIVPLNTRLQLRELEYAVLKTRARILLFVDAFRSVQYLPIARALLDGSVESAWCVVTQGEVSAPGIADFAELLKTDPGPSLPTVSPEADWLIQMTSGTTAFPKAAVLCHAQCVRMGAEIARRMELCADDRYFVCNPIYHLGCTNFALLASVAVGAAYFTLATFEADRALEVMAEHGCTVQHGIASHYLLELESPIFDASKPRLRTISVGGGNAIARKVYERFGSEGVLQRYGSTEAGGAPLVCGRTDPLETRLGTNGRPLPGMELAMSDPETGSLLPPGSDGEILIRGWGVMRRYDGDDEATRRAVRQDGWLRTGDLGRVDPSGNLVFFGRLKDALRVGGEMVASEELESTLVDHPAIVEAHVIPFPDPRLVEVPAAFVVLRPGVPLTSAELVTFLTGRLARFKWPRRVWSIDADALPRTGTEKVQKFKLQEMARTRVERSAPRAESERILVEEFTHA